MLYRFFPLLILVWTTSATAVDSVLQVDNARIHEAPPTIRVHAAYLDIHNSGPEPVALIAVSSPVFEYVEMHLSRTEDEVSRMRRQKTISIPAASSLSLEPGAYHLMLFNSNMPLPSGKQVPLELLFSNGEIVRLTAEVTRPGKGHNHHH